MNRTIIIFHVTSDHNSAISGVTTLAASFNRVDLATSKLTVASTAAAAGTGIAAGSASGLASLLAGFNRIDFALGKLCKKCQSAWIVIKTRDGRVNLRPVLTRWSGWPSSRRPPCSGDVVSK